MPPSPPPSKNPLTGGPGQLVILVLKEMGPTALSVATWSNRAGAGIGFFCFLGVFVETQTG